MKTLTYLFSVTLVTCLSHFVLLDVDTVIEFGKEYNREARYYTIFSIRLFLPPEYVVRQVLRSPKEAFAAAMQSWRERCEKCVCLQGDYVEK